MTDIYQSISTSLTEESDIWETHFHSMFPTGKCFCKWSNIFLIYGIIKYCSTITCCSNSIFPFENVFTSEEWTQYLQKLIITNNQCAAGLGIRLWLLQDQKIKMHLMIPLFRTEIKDFSISGRFYWHLVAVVRLLTSQHRYGLMATAPLYQQADILLVAPHFLVFIDSHSRILGKVVTKYP